jgi:hypothetical protein
MDREGLEGLNWLDWLKGFTPPESEHREQQPLLFSLNQ